MKVIFNNENEIDNVIQVNEKKGNSNTAKNSVFSSEKEVWNLMVSFPLTGDDEALKAMVDTYENSIAVKKSDGTTEEFTEYNYCQSYDRRINDSMDTVSMIFIQREKTELE